MTGKLFLQSLLAAGIVGFASNAVLADDLTGLWSYGLTSIRTGEPLIEEGGQHRIDPSDVSYGYNLVVSATGNTLSPTALPLHGGEQLRVTSAYQDDQNTREYARIVSIMAPIRDAILYDFETMSRSDWLEITEVLTLNGIKTKNAVDINARTAVLSTTDVWDYVSAGPSDGSAVMRYLEEAGLELKCLGFTNFNFVNPEGNDHCSDHGIDVGSGIKLP